MEEDLQALRSLYKFLQTNDPKHLDDKARLLLKHLLDSTTDNVLSGSRAMINASAEQSGAARTIGTAQSVQRNLKPPPLAGIQTPNRESIGSVSINDDGFLHRNLPRPMESQFNSELTISPSKVQNRKKRCRVCQQCIIKPETRSNNCSNKGDDRGGYQSLSRIDKVHFAKPTSQPNGNRVKSDLVKEINDSIMRIEHGILLLQINSGNVISGSCSTSSAAASDNHLSSPDKRSKQESGYGFDTNQPVQQKLQGSNRTNSLLDEDMGSLAPAVTRFTNVKNMVVRIESMNQAPNRTNESHHVLGLQKHEHIGQKSGDLTKAKPSMPQKQYGKSSTKGSLVQQRMFVGPTLLNYESDQKIGTTSRARAQSERGKMALQYEISSSTSPSRVRSTTNSPQSSIFSSSIEASATGESGDAASSNSSRSFYSSLHGSSSYELPDGNNSEESERVISSASPSYYSSNEDSSPRRFGRRRMYNRSVSSGRELRRGPGRLRRLKNKLGLIFHHHHHHHHHHHKYPDVNIDYPTTSKSMWKNLHKMVFHHKDDNKKSHERVKKEPKSSQALVSRNKKNNEQMGQFHELVEGLVRHVRHKSKKSKPDHVKKKKGLLKKKQTPKNRAKVKLGFKSRKSTRPKALRK